MEFKNVFHDKAVRATAELLGLNKEMISKCPNCGFMTVHLFDIYGFQEVKKCNCGCKHVVKFKKQSNREEI